MLERDLSAAVVARRGGTGQWAEVTCEHDGRIVARLPYVVRGGRGLRILTQSSLTHTLGPWVEPSTAKPSRALAREHELLAQLEAALPPARAFSQQFSPLMLKRWPSTGPDIGSRFVTPPGCRTCARRMRSLTACATTSAGRSARRASAWRSWTTSVSISSTMSCRRPTPGSGSDSARHAARRPTPGARARTASGRPGRSGSR